MSFIGKNIKKIRVVKKLSQADFAKLFNLARPSIGAYEEGRSEPKIDTIIEIAKKYRLSIDLLLTKELTINELFNFDIFKGDLKNHKSKPDSSPGYGGIPVVSARHSIEYIVKHKNQDFVKSLPLGWIPSKGPGLLRAFELSGTEMEHQQNGLHHGDILLTKRIAPPPPLNLKKDRIYVLVCPESIQIRRFKKGGKSVVFGADNPNYPDQELDPSKILEIWEVNGAYTTYLDPPEMLGQRMMILEQKFKSLEQKIKRNLK